MRNVIIIVLFLLGLVVFFYPIVSDVIATREHHTVVNQYKNMMDSLDKEQIEKEKKKAKEHNEELINSPVHYVDPFSETTRNKAENKSYYDALKVGPAMGSIEIPKLNIELPIYHGTSEEILSQGVGHLENSSFPIGKPGTHSVLTAHRGLPSAKLFRNLDDLTIGDQFFIQMLDEVFAYQVYRIEIVLPHETDWLQIDEEEDLVTLLTCEPYMINTHRLLVMGKRIPFKESIPLDHVQEKNNSIYLYSIPVLLFLIILIIIFQRKKKGRVDIEA